MKNYTLLLALLLCGCAAPQKLSDEAKRVRVITPGVATALSCTHLGLTTARGVFIEGGMDAAQIKIRNQVAAAGGNAMVVVHQYVESGKYEHGNISADAYRCP